MVAISPDHIKYLAPHALPGLREAFGNAEAMLKKYGVNANGLRMSHFMAQVLHETRGLTVAVENLDYPADRIAEIWHYRFINAMRAFPYSNAPELLANRVYRNWMGNDQPGDGWRFIGRGLLQITGKGAYRTYGKAIGVNLLENPDLAAAPQFALQLAGAQWDKNGCNDFADNDNPRRITMALHGALTEMASRRTWLARTKDVWLR
jgi:putative chitinase